MLRGATLAFKKIDSLLRGPWTAELAACLRSGDWEACIVAPAFPHQGRRTRNGRQYAAAADGSWGAVGPDIAHRLRERNIAARLGSVGERLAPGVTVFDAATDEDLVRIAELGRRYPGPVLWCGSGGLAGALAAGSDVRTSRKVAGPVLGVFGSDHAATAAQLARCGAATVPLTSESRIDVDAIRRRLADGLALVKLDAPAGSERAEAAAHFAAELAVLARSIDPPASLIVSGGETLKAQCLATGARTLKVTGRLEPGVPRSVIEDGAWRGVEVISKSGAFGPPDLWWNLFSQNALI
jgi:uncharacterized protein YgbK (DUF1537 family)